MRYGFFGDVHGEVERLELVIAKLKDGGIKKGFIISTGDIVSDDDHAKTHRIIELLKAEEITGVVGDHDEIQMTLGSESGAYFKELRWDRQMQIGDTIVIHDNPLADAQRGYGRWSHGSYIYEIDDAKSVFSEVIDGATKWVIVHNHISKVFIQKPTMNHGQREWCYDAVSFENGGIFRYNTDARYIFSPGSVSHSRDSNPAPACAIYDTEKMLFEVIRVDQKEKK